MSEASDSEEPIVGIDLGTTQSAIGIVEAGFPILLADAAGSRLTPSAVYFPRDGGVPVVGAAALRARAADPTRVVSSVKRLMGRRRAEVDEPDPRLVGAPNAPVALRIDDRVLTPESVSSEILQHLVRVAEAALDRPVRRAVITVPAYFNDAQRTATKLAGELAGLTVERILNEPTAAALAYGLDRLHDRSRIAVYDLGGGTFDISILELHDGVFQVLATHGDTHLGGDEIDQALAGTIWRKVEPGSTLDHLDPAARIRLIAAAEQAKITLSDAETCSVRLPFLRADLNLEVELTRTELERVADPILRRTIQPCRLALSDAGLQSDDLDAVVLVGGSTRTPAVRRLAAAIFEREPDVSQHPDEAVALGAVIQGGILTRSLRNLVLLDVTPLSLGIETFGGLMNVIIPRNTTIPCKAGEMFTNAVPDQESMLVRVLQGERELAQDNWELGRIALPFNPGPKGSARVGVQFRIDENGILEVLARDTATGRESVLAIENAAVNVDDDSVERMISDSIEHAFDDMNARILTEQQQKARELLKATAAALAAAGARLPATERTGIEAAAAEVTAALEGNDPSALQRSCKHLEEVTEGLAVLLVEMAFENAGHT